MHSHLNKYMCFVWTTISIYWFIGLVRIVKGNIHHNVVPFYEFYTPPLAITN